MNNAAKLRVGKSHRSTHKIKDGSKTITLGTEAATGAAGPSFQKTSSWTWTKSDVKFTDSTTSRFYRSVAPGLNHETSTPTDSENVKNLRYVIGISAGVGSFIILLIFLIVCCICFRKRKTSKLNKNIDSLQVDLRSSGHFNSALVYSKTSLCEDASAATSSGIKKSQDLNHSGETNSNDEEVYKNGIVPMQSTLEAELEDTKL